MNSSQAYEAGTLNITQLYRKNDPNSGSSVIEIAETDYTLRYLCPDGIVRERTARMFCPTDKISGKRPLMFNVHYEWKKDDGGMFDLLQQGWAVLTNIDLPPDSMANIVAKDLRYNMALLELAGRLDWVDPQRICLRGGSAGGYQTWMLCSTHLGILSAYSLMGVVNLSYNLSYFFNNQLINESLAAKNTQDNKDEPGSYPFPAVKGGYNLLYETGIWLGEKDMQTERWKKYSPVLFLERVVNPMLMAHSTADALVPMGQLSQKHVRQTESNPLPDFKFSLDELLDDAQLVIPLDELLSEDKITIYTFSPNQEKDNWPVPISFDPAKQYNLTLIDEGVIEARCVHFKDAKVMDSISDLAFWSYYKQKTASSTNVLTLDKVRFLAQRYMGEALIFAEENQYKAQCDPVVFGSLQSDRREILRSLLVYFGLDPHEAAKGIADHTVQANVEAFADYYQQLDERLRFLDEGRSPLSMENAVTRVIEQYRSMILH